MTGLQLLSNLAAQVKRKRGDYYEDPIFGSGRKSGQFFSQARQKYTFNFIVLGFVRAFENCLGGWLKKSGSLT